MNENVPAREIVPPPPRDSASPRLFEGEMELLTKLLREASAYLEYGTGGSTILAARSGVQRIVSVDSDEAWQQVIAKKATAENFRDIIEFRCCDLSATGDWRYPIDRQPKESWVRYVVSPWQVFLAWNAAPDLIYLDGRFRVACALYSILMLGDRAACIAVHDFTARDHYKLMERHAEMIECSNTLAVFIARQPLALPELVKDLMLYQFDVH